MKDASKYANDIAKERVDDATQHLKVGDKVVTAKNIMIATGSSVIGEDGKRQLAAFADTLKNIAARIPFSHGDNDAGAGLRPDSERAIVDKAEAGGQPSVGLAHFIDYLEALKAGRSHVQVGQRPFEMGYKTMMALEAMKSGKPAPADPTYTGLDVCTPETADTCIGK